LASATTPESSGPRFSGGPRACGSDGVEEIESLVAELLAELKALRNRQRGRELGFLARLFLVDLCPLGLVTGFEQVVSPRCRG
jgi:hypothetical protein